MAKKSPKKVVPVGKVKDAEVLSPLQKTFRARLRKVEKLKKEMSDTEEAIQVLQKRHLTDVVPLEKEVNTLRVSLFKSLDEWHGKLGVRYQKWISDFIYEFAFNLVGDEYPELEAIYDRHAPISFKQEEEEIATQEMEGVRQSIHMMTGFDIGDQLKGVDFRNPEEMNRVMREIMEKGTEFVQEQQQFFEESQQRRERKKTAKQQQREEERAKMKEEQDKMLNKTLRSLYLELVKEYHPDREPDEEKRAFKTDLMKQITQAYDKGDIAKLMELQISYLEKDEANFLHLPEDRLRVYVKLFTEQVQEMEDELRMMRNAPEPFNQYIYYALDHAQSANYAVDQRIMNLKQMQQQLKEELKMCGDAASVKELLKSLKDMMKNY